MQLRAKAFLWPLSQQTPHPGTYSKDHRERLFVGGLKTATETDITLTCLFYGPLEQVHRRQRPARGHEVRERASESTAHAPAEQCLSVLYLPNASGVVAPYWLSPSGWLCPHGPAWERISGRRVEAASCRELGSAV